MILELQYSGKPISWTPNMETGSSARFNKTPFAKTPLCVPLVIVAIHYRDLPLMRRHVVVLSLLWVSTIMTILPLLWPTVILTSQYCGRPSLRPSIIAPFHFCGRPSLWPPSTVATHRCALPPMWFPTIADHHLGSKNGIFF